MQKQAIKETLESQVFGVRIFVGNYSIFDVLVEMLAPQNPAILAVSHVSNGSDLAGVAATLAAFTTRSYANAVPGKEADKTLSAWMCAQALFSLARSICGLFAQHPFTLHTCV